MLEKEKELDAMGLPEALEKKLLELKKPPKDWEYFIYKTPSEGKFELARGFLKLLVDFGVKEKHIKMRIDENSEISIEWSKSGIDGVAETFSAKGA